MTPTLRELNTVLNDEARLIARRGRLCAALACVNNMTDGNQLKAEAESNEIELTATRVRLRELQQEVARERGNDAS